MKFIFILLLLQACTVGPDYKRPDIPLVEHYTTDDQAHDQKNTISPDWWKLFHSPLVNTHVEKMIQENFSLKAALATLKQSQYLLEAGHGVFYPQVNLSGATTRQKLNTGSFGGQFPSRTFNLTTLSGSVSYALDFFGQQRRAVESLQSQMEYQRYVASGVYLSLTGNVVNTLIARAGYQEQIYATEKIVNSLKEEITIAKAQTKAGRLAESALLSFQSQLLSAEENFPVLKQKIHEAEHLIALLSGHGPESTKEQFPALSDFQLNEKIPLIVPSELIKKRPDILAAEAELKTASAEVGVATAALYPSFSLTGTFGIFGTTINGLKGAQNNFWNLGLGFTAPLFHGGTLRANKKAAIEQYNSSLASYRQTILSAFSEIANLLRAIENDEASLAYFNEALLVSQKNLSLVKANFASGVSDYLQVLNALVQVQQAENGTIQMKAKKLQDTVALLIALGGGVK